MERRNIAGEENPLFGSDFGWVGRKIQEEEEVPNQRKSASEKGSAGSYKLTPIPESFEVGP